MRCRGDDGPLLRWPEVGEHDVAQLQMHERDFARSGLGGLGCKWGGHRKKKTATSTVGDTAEHEEIF